MSTSAGPQLLQNSLFGGMHGQREQICTAHANTSRCKATKRSAPWERDGGQVADRSLVLARVLHDFRAQVAALDRAEVLLVALAVAAVLEEHVGVASLHLRLEDCKPELLRGDGLEATALTLIPAEGIEAV